MNQISCPSCQKAYQLDESHYGRSFQCTCGAMVSVPPKAASRAAYSPGSKGDENAAADFLAFRRFITPALIQVIFWLGVIGIVVFAVMIMDHDAGTGVLYLILGPVIWRMYCEIMIVIFTISDTLTDIKSNTAK